MSQIKHDLNHEVYLDPKDKKDPEWSWMNNLTSKEVQSIIEKAIQLDK